MAQIEFCRKILAPLKMWTSICMPGHKAEQLFYTASSASLHKETEIMKLFDLYLKINTVASVNAT